MDLSVCVVIPAFNEESSIGQVVQRVRVLLPHATVVVVNDGSLDATTAAAMREGARVLALPFNLGIGGAVQTGLKYGWRQGFDAVLEIDADGQHDPNFARRLIDELHNKKADLVIGSRFIASTAYRSSILRRFGIHLFSWLIKLVTGRRVYDSTSGYRAYSRRAINFLKDRYPTDFPEPESIVMLLQNGFRIVEVPVEMGRRTGGHSVVRHDFSWKASYFVLSNAIAILVSSLKRRNARYATK